MIGLVRFDVKVQGVNKLDLDFGQRGQTVRVVVLRVGGLSFTRRFRRFVSCLHLLLLLLLLLSFLLLP